MIASLVWGLLATAVAPTSTASAVGFRFTVLHTNDMHSRFEETCDGGGGGGSCAGGFPRLRTVLDTERARAAADGAPAVFLDAGDVFYGTPFYDVLGWEPAADFVGDLGVDAMCLGNHEFHNGPKVLASYLKSINISSLPIVVANIITEKEPSLSSIRPSTVLTIDGHTIGVVGYLTPDTEWLNVVGNVKITDELEGVRSEVSKLKKSGVEFIIALGHSGMEMDRRIAREVDDVDVVIGGHSHSYLSNVSSNGTERPVGPYPILEQRGEKIVPVVQAFAFTKYLGKLILSFNSKRQLIIATGGLILLDQTIPQDIETLEKVKYYKQLLVAKNVNNKYIGMTKVFLDGNCKCTETNLADLVTDSFIRFNLKNLLNNNITLTGWTDASIAITTSGSIQRSINASKTEGQIYIKDIEYTLPYKTTLYKITITGSTLKNVLENSAYIYDYKDCAVPEKNIYGGFIQMSGIHVTYNMKNLLGSRVQSIMILCSECKVPSYEHINLDKKYTIITTKYLINGGDGYKMIKDGKLNEVNLNITETEALEIYVKEMSPIYTGVDNRIIILNKK